jgi:hypothetical protein
MLKQLCVLLLCSKMVSLPARAADHSQRSPILIAPAATSNIPAASLPESVASAVFQDIEARWAVDPAQMQVTQAESRLWSDGCLGLAPPGEFCQEVLVMGWQVTVAHRRQQWVYRSNNSGGLVLWDQAGSKLDSLFTLQSQPIDGAERLKRLPKKVVFSAVTSGSAADGPQETLLFQDGRILQRVDSKAPLAENQRVAQISPEAVKTFENILRQQQFHQFDGLCYSALDGVVNIKTTVFRSRKTTVCYADLNTVQLPAALQSVIQAWTELIMRP